MMIELGNGTKSDQRAEMRQDLIEHGGKDADLASVEDDLVHLLYWWFDRGFPDDAAHHLVVAGLPTSWSGSSATKPST